MNKYFLVLASLVQLYSCNAPQKTKRIILEQRNIISKEDASFINELQTGIDFIGSGNSPEKWRLEMDFDERISFYYGKNLFIHATAVNPIASDKNTQVYHCISGNQNLSISLKKSAHPTNIEVAINAEGKNFIGNGKFLRNYLLHDEWVLEKIGKNSIDSNHKPPSIRFNLINNTLNGFDGIIKYKGTFQEKGNYIKFEISSKNNQKITSGSFADILWNHLDKHEIEFLIRQDKLAMILNDDSRIFLKKKQ